MKIHSGSLTAVIYVLLPLTISCILALPVTTQTEKWVCIEIFFLHIVKPFCRGCLWQSGTSIFLVHKSVSLKPKKNKDVENVSVKEWRIRFHRAVCLAQTKQADVLSEQAFYTDLRLFPSRTHKGKKKSFETRSLIYFKGGGRGSGSVSLKKAHTPILIAEQNVERG